MDGERKGQQMKTAEDFLNNLRGLAAAEGRWVNGQCYRCYSNNLNQDNECRDCIDDAHEAWINSRHFVL